MDVLVTGGAGFIGSNLCKSLNRNGLGKVRVLDDLSTGSSANLKGVDVDLLQGSLLETGAVDNAVAGVDVIVHLAAIPSVPRSVANPRASHDANVTGTLNLLEAARAAGVQQVIVASSSSVYGSNMSIPKSEYDWTRPMSPYAVTKQATEAYALAYQYSYGLRTLAFRFFNVYGPAQVPGHAYAAVIPQFLDAALRGRPVEIHGDGTQSRDFTFVDSVCAVIVDALNRGVHSVDPVNLAFGTTTSLLELLDIIEELLGHSVERNFTIPRVGDVRASQANSTRFAEMFPTIAPVSLRDGLAATIDWYKHADRRQS
jgi:UDP-glucose 4-epimerase